MYIVVLKLNIISANPLLTMAVQIVVGAITYLFVSAFFMVKVRKSPELVETGATLSTLKKVNASDNRIQ